MHYYTMNLEDGQQISIVSNAHNTATIIKNINTTLPPTFQYQLAKTLQEAAKPSRTGNRMGCYVAVKNTKQIDLDKVSEDFLRSKKILAPQYSYVMDCKCRKLVRTDTEEMKQMITCKCTRRYHPECYQLPNNRAKFVCGPCNIITPGVVWSENYQNGTGPTNTCCIDNFINALLLESEQHKDLAKKLHNTYYKKQKIPIFHMLESCQRKKFGDAQTNWLYHMRERKKEIPLVETNRNIFGGEEEQVMRYLKGSSTFQYNYKCQNSACGNELTDTTETFTPTRILPTDSQRKSFDEAFLQKRDIQCTKCNNSMEMTGLGVTNPPAYFLRLSTLYSSPTVENIQNHYPKETTINDLKYNLKYITLNGGGHFTSVIWHNNEWLHFDDMGGAHKFRYPLKSDLDTSVVEFVTYFLDQKHL